MRYIEKFKVPSDLFVLGGDMIPLSGEIEKENGTLSVTNGALSCKASFTEHKTGVISRRDTVKNVTDEPIRIDCALSKFVFDGGEYRVFTEYSEWCGEGMGKWQELVTEISASNDDIRMNVMSTPFVGIYNVQTGRGVAFHILAESTWCYKVRKFYSAEGHRKVITVELGIRERGFSYDLGAGEELVLPEILFYEFKNTTDLDAYKLHRYINERYPARSMPVIYDTWMSNFDDIDFDQLSAQLAEARRIGCDYFVVDAGWFGQPHVWADNVGDWKECLDFSMRGRLRELADAVRASGLKFGLWFEIERAALAAQTVKDHPEYYFREGNHYFLDFAKPDACEYIYAKLEENILKYGIEFIKFDFNAEITFDSAHRSFLDYFKGYNGFIARIRKEHPEIYLQNCASGGLRLALATLFGFDSFWISDNHSMYTQLEIFKSALRRLPSRALEKWMTIRSLTPFTPVYGGGECEKILSSGDAAWGHMEVLDKSFLCAAALGGPLGISCDLVRLSDETKDMLATMIRQFKQDRDFWASSECRILTDTESMLVLAFSDAEFTDVRVHAYVKVPHQNTLTVYPEVMPDATYTVGDATLTGEEILRDGIEMAVGARYTASTLLLKQV